VLTVRGVNFWIFLDFQYLTTAFVLAKEFLCQSRNSFFPNFHVFLSGSEFLGPKKEKISPNRVNYFSLNRSIWVLQIPQFYADFKMGQFTFVTSDYQKLEPNRRVLETFF
jgi:hypothetical protein